MPYPEIPGKPCWNAEQVENVIAIAAQTNEQSAEIFLAAHSPFRFITNFRDPTGHEHTEEEVFEAIFRRHGEVQAAIKGEPGTGKSHLVRWLKLRTDFEAESGDELCERFVRIVVQRGNGSLKDMLRQIVERLGEGFRDHLLRLQGAIDKISAQTASAMLLSELALEIGERWGRERKNREPLPRRLKLLPVALKSRGVERWLRRQGGVVDQVIRRLAVGAPVAEWDTFPEFTPEELTPALTYLSIAENSDDVCEFFRTDLPGEPQLRQAAAEALNLALRDAMWSLTGLSGSTLREIFDDIRRDLFKQKKELALFIEDVSVTGLDRDIINALEPQKRDGLCRMIAVIGITSNAFMRLEDNQKQRFDPTFEVGAGVTARWSSDRDEVASFTARYLNAIRCSGPEIAKLAATRRERGSEGDQPMSKCDACPARQPCHAAFGYVKLSNGVEIGTFPFTPGAPHALLGGLNEDVHHTGVARSQRGLIENVLLPVLQRSRNALESQEFPSPALLPVKMMQPTFWTGFSHKYLGGGAWNEANKDRLQILATYWADGANAEDLARDLAPLLKPLFLPPFAIGAPHPTGTGRGEPKVEPSKPPERRKPQPELPKKIQTLTNWFQGGRLTSDGEFRDLLKDLFNYAIQWQDEPGLPVAEAERIVKTNKFPSVQDQLGNPQAQARVYKLPRDPETRDLLEALVQFSIAGKGTWDFDHAEIHKRAVCRWLRKHRKAVINTVKPDAPVDPSQAVIVAARALAIGAILRDRKPLPKDPEERLARLLSNLWNEEARPMALADPMRELIDDLEKRQSLLLDFIVAELGAGQGRSEPKDYLDPTPLLRSLEDDSIELPTLVPEIHQSFWQKRFVALRGLAAFEDLTRRTEAERAKAEEVVTAMRDLLNDSGARLDPDPRAGVEAWLSEFADLIEAQRGSKTRRYKLDVPHPAFDGLWEERRFQTQVQREKLASALSNAIDASKASPEELSTLLYDPSPLCDLERALSTAHAHLQKVSLLISDIEEHLVGKDGGSRDGLITELDGLAKLAGRSTTEETTCPDEPE
jgi:hypothetical protein